MRSSNFTPEVSRRWLLIGVVVVASLAGITIYALGALQPLQNAAIDESFSLEAARLAPADIVIVAVDNFTLQRINSQLPIPRSYYARLLDVLHRARPRLIGVDLQFIGASRHPEQDRALLSALARDGPVLVSVSDNGAGAPTIVGVRSPQGVMPASGAVDVDSDGVLRKLLYVQVHLQTFPIRAAEIVRGQPIPAALVPGNHAWIDFAGPPGTYRTYSMADVLNGRIPPAAFAGKIVLVGVTAPIGKDVFITSASSNPMSGVEVQANSIETALRGFPLRSSNSVLSVALIIALAVAPVLLGLLLSSLLVGLSSIVLAALFLGAVEFAFAHGLILPVPDPIVGLGIATSGIIAVESFIERRKRLSLEALLQDFLRPAEIAFFVSYRRDQSSFVAQSLQSALVARFGKVSIFMDVTDISPGQEWPREIQEAILGCSAMLVIIGPYWLRAPDAASDSRRLDDPEDWVRREVEAGLARPEVAVIPVLVEGATMPGKGDLPQTLSSLSNREAFVLTGRNLGQEVDALIDGIRRGQLGPLRRVGARQPPPEVQDYRSTGRRRTRQALRGRARRELLISIRRKVPPGQARQGKRSLMRH
jgi:CHASE2 domain-containing sensor protein